MITKKFRRGLMTDEERHQKVIEAWNIADDKITAALLAGLGKYNNIYMVQTPVPWFQQTDQTAGRYAWSDGIP